MTFASLFEQPAVAPHRPLVGRGIPLRYPQREDCDALMHAIEGGYTHPACIGATGYGKGPIIAEMGGRLLRNGGTGLMLVNRAHLVYQLADEIERHLGMEVGRVADGVCDRIHLPIVVSTVQAMYTPDATGRPLYTYPAFKNVKFVIPDEAHLFFADCYRAVITHFVEMQQAVVPMFTATPVAANGARWSSFVNWTAGAEGPCMRTVRWCVENGYLVRPRQAFIQVNLDLAPIYDQLSTAEDPDAVDDDEREDASAVLLDLLRDKGERDAATFAAGVADVIGDRRAIIFSPPRVKAAKTLASWLNATGRMSCDAVWGARSDKMDLLNGFKRGNPQVLTNPRILCEGFNDPTVSAVFICCLIREWRIAQQMVGRGLRPHPSIIDALNSFDGPDESDHRRRVIAESVKPDALIADLVGLDGKVLQASAVEVLFADETDDVKDAISNLLKPAGSKPREDVAEMPDKELLEIARREVAVKQREQLEEMARRRGMAGELQASVNVQMDGAGPDLPSVPSPITAATVGEKAMFVAFAVQYDTDRAIRIAERTPKHILKGMTWSFKRKLDKEGLNPDWNRARKAFPEWQSSKKRKGVA